MDVEWRADKSVKDISTPSTPSSNKVMVIDGKTAITGSFNFTTAAKDNNAVNLLVVQDAEMAAKCARTAFQEVTSIGSFRQRPDAPSAFTGSAPEMLLD